MTIRSNPPGAQVYVDNHEIGRTPVSTDFIYYGKREIRLVKDGFETLTVKQPVSAPWYQIPGIDFFSENLYPGEIRDERQFDYQMQPLLVVPSEQLLSRGEELRRGNQAVPVAAPNVYAPAAIGTPGTMVPSNVAPSPYVVPPGGFNTTPAPGAPTLPPPAILNYPPNAPNGGAPISNLKPGDTYLPPDYGGRPVSPLP